MKFMLVLKITAGLGLILGVGFLILHLSQPVRAAEGVPAERDQVSLPLRPHPSHLSLTQQAVTAISNNGSIVYNGDWITYTLTLRNNNGASASNVIVENPMSFPISNPADVRCQPAPECKLITATQTITTRAGSITVQRVNAARWSFTSVTSNKILTLSVRVTCQTGADQLSNYATVTYKHAGNSTGFEVTDPVVTDIQVAPPDPNSPLSLSKAPEFCSYGTTVNTGANGGISGMDWGDFDQDGDLDVVLGSYDEGAFVYRNNNGSFGLFWHNTDGHRAEGVRWADFNNDGYLELLLSGQWENDGEGTPPSPATSPFPDGSGTYDYVGLNYLYAYNGNDRFVQYDDFQTNDGAWRAEIADFTGDGYPDLAMINYWGGCTVHLYKNLNNGQFERSSPPETSADSSYCLFGPPYELYSRPARSAAWGDVDNDGDPDLAVGVEDPSNSSLDQILLFENDPPGSFTTPPVEIDLLGNSAPWDLAWGDYDADGYLDLAVALSDNLGFPLNLSSSFGAVLVYHYDQGSGTFELEFHSGTLAAVGAVEWADLNGDGRLELAVAEYNKPPRIYHYNGANFSLLTTLQTASNGDSLGFQAVDYDNDGDLDLAMSNTKSESWLFANTTPLLARQATPVQTALAHSVAWGNVDAATPDDPTRSFRLELLYGTTSVPKLYTGEPNDTFLANGATFSNAPAQAAIFGYVNGDSYLDVILGLNGRTLLYFNDGLGNFTGSPNQTTEQIKTYGLVMADTDQDNRGRQDLIIGADGHEALYTFPTLQTAHPQASWFSPVEDDTRGIAWGYYNNDILPDFATANNGQPVRIYIGNAQHNFTLAQSLPDPSNNQFNSRAVAWADYDGDGDLDLAVGNYDQKNQLYQNQGGTLTLSWSSPLARKTTSLAWGDWDNDGDPDLAVGNEGQPNQVYTNQDSTPGRANLAWTWQSAESYETTSVAWGDYDADGDLDLGFSQKDPARSLGYYRNGYAAAVHTVNNFRGRMPLPQNPPYVYITPSVSQNQIFTREVLADPSTLEVPIEFLVYDPDGSRQAVSPAPVGNPVKIIRSEYSLDDGGQWFNATVTPTLNLLSTIRQHSDSSGQPYTLIWKAGQDLLANNPNQPVSDLVRFRLTIAQQNKNIPAGSVTGPFQKIVSRAVSQPFRVRNLSCIWPEAPKITVQPATPVAAGSKLKFQGEVTQQGILFYNWDFGDGTLMQGQIVQHSFLRPGPQVITLTVSQPPCPVTRPDFSTKIITIEGWTNPVFLPLLLKSGLESTAGPEAPDPELPVEIPALQLAEGAPAQLQTLEGESSPAGTRLSWKPVGEAVLGYRVYGATVNQPFKQVAELSAGITTYLDSSASCGAMYFVTAFNSAGESGPSLASYNSPACP